ncbi:RAD9, HUS1, RAD1-interacting nuclear orphan protein 1 [Pelodytes ibericus]
MPRRKRTTCNPRKGQLVFLESPQPGLLHEYGAPPQKADPIRVPTRPLDHNASTSWVSPQFEQMGPIHFQGRRRPQHVSVNSTVHSRTHETSCVGGRSLPRKPSVCKFPSLSFDSQTIAAKSKKQSVCARRKPALPVCTKGRINPPLSPVPQDISSSSAPSPPDIRTPNRSPQYTPSTKLPAESRTPLSREQSEQPDGLDTPSVRRQGQVLAEDTPEQDYGVRVTWRRRQQLMRYLKERGKLKSSEILVKQ